MKGQLWLGLLGVFLLLVGCGGNEEASQSSTAQPGAGTTQSQGFAAPLVSQSSRAGTVRPVPGLLQPTNPKTRASSIVTGRRDPFAAIPSATVPIVVSSKRSSASKISVTPLPTAKAAPMASRLPSIPLPPLPAQPPALPNVATAPLPPIGVPGVPSVPATPPSRTALADSVQVSGVVQVKGRWNVIVKEPTATSSRYVAVGEYLENGKILVKKILSPGSSEPVVVLQQNGVEVQKSLV